MREREGSGDDAWMYLFVPGTALLIVVGLVGYTIVTSISGGHTSIQSVSVAENTPATPPQTPSQRSQLTAGKETAASGATGEMAGDFAVKAGWIKNLRAASGGFGGQASWTRFAGNGFYEEGTRELTNRAWRIASLWPAPAPQFVVATLAGSSPAPISLASPTPALASSGTKSAGLLKQAAVDFPDIIFAPNSTRVPSRSLPLLRRVAERIRQLPAGASVQIEGYTRGAARSAVNAELSQRRADTVYRILVREGVSPAVLSAKGYGSSPSVASINGETEGRGKKMRGEAGRRVEFRVVQPAP